MEQTSRRTQVSFLHKMYFALSIVAVLIGLAGIAGGVVLIIFKPGTVAAVCGSVVIFVSFCLTTIPIGTSLLILHLRLKCQGSCLVITKSYIDLTRPRPRSFRSINGGNNDAGTVFTNPVIEKETKTYHSTLLRNYHEVRATESQDVAMSADTQDVAPGRKTTDKVEKDSEQSRSNTSTSRKKKAPPVPQTVLQLPMNSTEVKQSPRLGKPVPVPVVPIGYYNQVCVEPTVKSQADESTNNDEFQMTVSIETVSQQVSRNTSAYTATEVTPQSQSTTPSQRTLAPNEFILPPRNVSSLYPSISNAVTYEEMGTQM